MSKREEMFWVITPLHLKINKMNEFWLLYNEKYPILKDWSFEWKKMYSIAGLTHYPSKTIKISVFLLIGNTPIKEVKNVILHEIAHVLTEQESKEHGNLWKDTFITIGGNGKRLSEMNIPNQYYNWGFSCKNKRCLEFKNRNRFLYKNNWKKMRCWKCKCFMKKSNISGGEDKIKNGYLLQ